MKNKKAGRPSLSKRNDRSEDFRAWTDRKLVRVATKTHEELEELDGGTESILPASTHDAMAHVLGDFVEELKKRGWRVEGINDKKLAITREEKE